MVHQDAIMCARKHAHMYVCIYLSIYLCIYVSMFVSLYLYMYIHAGQPRCPFKDGLGRHLQGMDDAVI